MNNLSSVQVEDLTFNFESEKFEVFTDVDNLLRYLKTKYSNSARCRNRVFDLLFRYARAYEKSYLIDYLENLVSLVDKVDKFSYKEAFELTNTQEQILVFGSINIPDMIKELGATRIKVEGKDLKNRKYKEDGTYTLEDYTVIYELYKVNCKKLRVDDSYVVKCWCTSTDKEHYLWVSDEYIDSPLEAIASNCYIYPNMIDKIDCIKRQGDIFLFEMQEEVFPEGTPIPIPMDLYFSKLVAQS